MKLVIDIPDTMYDWFMNGFPDDEDAAMLCELVVQNGKPYEQKTCHDCISREEAMRPFDLVQQDDLAMSYDDIAKFLSKLPSVEPEQKEGKWIPYYAPGFGDVYCSQCKHSVYDPDDYCPCCGSHNDNMRGTSNDRFRSN